jgi:RNA polymerase sigma-70 factor (ECF subfamily)
MPQSLQEQITGLLRDWSRGDLGAREKLMPLVYQELRRMARRHMSAQPLEHSLQVTELIHEAYLKLAGEPERHWENRTHFFAVAATAMRQILIDHARARHRFKRGGNAKRVSLDDAPELSADRARELVALDDALDELATHDPRKSQVVELRFFGGLTEPEIACELKVSVETVKRDWRFAKDWLERELERKERS